MHDIKEQILADAIAVCIKNQQTIRHQKIAIIVLSVALIVMGVVCIL